MVSEVKHEYPKVVIYDHVLADISKARPLTGEEYRVFMCLLGKVKRDNTVPGPSETAKELDLRQPNVSRAYGELLKYGYLLKDDKGYHIHPMIAWYGSESRRIQAIEKALIATLPASPYEWKG